MTDLAETPTATGEPITLCRGRDLDPCPGPPAALPHDPDDDLAALHHDERPVKPGPEALLQHELERDHLNNCGLCQRSILHCYQQGCLGARAGLVTIHYAITRAAIAHARGAFGQIPSEVEEKWEQKVSRIVARRLASPATLASMSNSATQPLTGFFSWYAGKDAITQLNKRIKDSHERAVYADTDSGELADLGALAREPDRPMPGWNLSFGGERASEDDFYDKAYITDAREEFLDNLPALTNAIVDWVNGDPELGRGHGRGQVPGDLIVLAYLEQIRFFTSDPVAAISMNSNPGKAKEKAATPGEKSIPRFAVNDRETIRLITATGEAGISPATAMRYRGRLTELLLNHLNQPDSPPGLSIVCAAFTQHGGIA